MVFLMVLFISYTVDRQNTPSKNIKNTYEKAHYVHKGVPLRNELFNLLLFEHKYQKK